jgi:hypothetical protein
VEDAGFHAFNVIAATFYEHSQEILRACLNIIQQYLIEAILTISWAESKVSS